MCPCSAETAREAVGLIGLFANSQYFREHDGPWMLPEPLPSTLSSPVDRSCLSRLALTWSPWIVIAGWLGYTLGATYANTLLNKGRPLFSTWETYVQLGTCISRTSGRYRVIFQGCPRGLGSPGVLPSFVRSPRCATLSSSIRSELKLRQATSPTADRTVRSICVAVGRTPKGCYPSK